MNKTCGKCGEHKELSEFGKNKAAKDGLQSRCKPCHSQAVVESVRKHWDKRRVYLSEWKSTNQDRVKASQRRRQEHNNERRRRNRVEHPNKQKAQSAVANAVAFKRLKSPGACEACSATVRLHAHHDSYEPSQWLVVRWLCPVCHRRHHMENEGAAFDAAMVA